MSEKNPSLEENLVAFKKELPTLLKENNGRFAVGNSIKGFTCWDTYGDASQYGNMTYSPQNFLIKEVTPIDQVKYFTRDITGQVAPWG